MLVQIHFGRRPSVRRLKHVLHIHGCTGRGFFQSIAIAINFNPLNSIMIAMLCAFWERYCNLLQSQIKYSSFFVAPRGVFIL